LQAIGDARLQIDDIIRGTTDPPPAAAIPTTAHLGTRWGIAAAAGSALLAALAMWAFMRPAAPDGARPARFEIVPLPEQFLSINDADRNLAISPDGQHIVYRGGPRDQLVVRSLDRIQAQVLEDTTNARYPFFSPDGQWVGFFDGVTLKKVAIAGGPAIPICPSQIPRGADWDEDGTIVFATLDTATGLLRVSASGGEPTVLTRPDPGEGELDHVALSLLPDGRGVLFTILPSSAAAPLQIAVLDLRTGQRKTLIRGGSQPEYAETGHLVYAAGRSLTAVRFDLERLAVQGDPVLLVEDVLRRVDSASANYAVSRGGALVQVPAGTVDSPGSLIWVDRSGRQSPTGAPPHIYAGPRLSPDGTRVAVTLADRQNDLHVLDLKKGTLLRLAQSPAVEYSPVWTRDGQRLVFASNRDGGRPNLFSQSADGTGTVERLTNAPFWQHPAWVAPDGTGILGLEIAPKTAGDIVWFPIQDPARRTPASLASSEAPRRLVETLGIDFFPEVSPNGRFIAYQSNESGRSEIYVRPFPRVDEGVWHVSVNGGIKPVWARNGRELFYLDPAHALIAVPVETSGTTFGFSRPSKLFDVSVDATYAPRDYDVAADGRFLMVERSMPANQRQQTLVVVLNWFEELKARLPAGR
jgi:serine/threonine-protein kinase